MIRGEMRGFSYSACLAFAVLWMHSVALGQVRNASEGLVYPTNPPRDVHAKRSPAPELSRLPKGDLTISVEGLERGEFLAKMVVGVKCALSPLPDRGAVSLMGFLFHKTRDGKVVANCSTASLSGEDLRKTICHKSMDFPAGKDAEVLGCVVGIFRKNLLAGFVLEPEESLKAIEVFDVQRLEIADVKRIGLNMEERARISIWGNERVMQIAWKMLMLGHADVARGLLENARGSLQKQRGEKEELTPATAERVDGMMAQTERLLEMSKGD